MPSVDQSPVDPVTFGSQSFTQVRSQRTQMYERFTNRARKVMQLAEEEARRLNQEFIGTEHILLGLVDEGSGVAAHVLKSLGVEIRFIRMEIEKIMWCPPGPPIVTGFPLTPRSKKVIDYAIREAHSLSHHYVGTEHLLLGLLCDQESAAARVLLNAGLELETTSAAVVNLLGCRVDFNEPGAVE